MANTTKLNDLQLVLLSTAAQRDDGNLFPAADSVAKEEDRIGKAIPQLLKRALVEEKPIKDRRLAWREEDEQPIGLFITTAGRELIGPAEGAQQPGVSTESTAKAGNKVATNARAGSKAEMVLGLLRRPEGATLSELVDVTGWLPHTTRAALTGLRRKGHVVEKFKRDDATCYRIAEAG
jgi:hypothetical protein